MDFCRGSNFRDELEFDEAAPGSVLTLCATFKTAVDCRFAWIAGREAATRMVNWPASGKKRDFPPHSILSGRRASFGYHERGRTRRGSGWAAPSYRLVGMTDPDI